MNSHAFYNGCTVREIWADAIKIEKDCRIMLRFDYLMSELYTPMLRSQFHLCQYLQPHKSPYGSLSSQFFKPLKFWRENEDVRKHLGLGDLWIAILVAAPEMRWAPSELHDGAALSMGWEEMEPEVHFIFQLGEKSEQRKKEYKSISFKSDTNEWFKSILACQKLNTWRNF